MLSAQNLIPRAKNTCSQDIVKTTKDIWLIDVETDRLIFCRDVVFDEERGPFQLSSPILCPKDQPLKAKDLVVRLPLYILGDT